MVTDIKAGLLPREAVRRVQDRLAAAGCPDADFDARALVHLVTGREPRMDDRPLTGDQAARLAGLTDRRAAREPLQYLAGRWPFLDFTLAVGPGVLCPRADTETVIEALRDQPALAARSGEALAVLDLCAGTGALGLGFARFWPAARVTCVEKSPAALVWLRQNAAHALPDRTVQAREGDLFTWYRDAAPAALDVILCNPPYLTRAEMAHLQPEVAHEPALALDGGPDGLDFYRCLAEHYQGLLRPAGWLALEIGWQQQAAVTDLLAAAGWRAIQCRQDWNGQPRCILARPGAAGESPGK